MLDNKDNLKFYMREATINISAIYRISRLIVHNCWLITSWWDTIHHQMRLFIPKQKKARLLFGLIHSKMIDLFIWKNIYLIYKDHNSSSFGYVDPVATHSYSVWSLIQSIIPSLSLPPLNLTGSWLLSLGYQNKVG